MRGEKLRLITVKERNFDTNGNPRTYTIISLTPKLTQNAMVVLQTEIMAKYLEVKDDDPQN